MRQAAVLLLLRAESNEHILRSAMQALNVALVRPNSIQLDYPIVYNPLLQRGFSDMEANPCTLTLEDGTHYDLTQLASSKADYVAQVGDTTYSLNVCRSVVSELYKLDDPDKVGGFFRQADGDFSLGLVLSDYVMCRCDFGLMDGWSER